MRLEPAEEAKRLVLLREEVEVELRDGDIPVRARLIDVETAERADDDVATGLAGLAADVLPVVESLVPVRGKVLCFARALHLDDADARPDHVDDPAAGRLLEVRDRLPVDVVASEQLVQERLSLAALGP